MDGGQTAPLTQALGQLQSSCIWFNDPDNRRVFLSYYKIPPPVDPFDPRCVGRGVAAVYETACQVPRVACEPRNVGLERQRHSPRRLRVYGSSTASERGLVRERDGRHFE